MYIFGKRCCLALVAAGYLFAQLPAPPGTPITIILDTDVGEDIGDANALSDSVWMQQNGYVKLAAVICTTSVSYTASYAETVLHYSGIDNIPIGAWQQAGLVTTDNYAQSTVGHYALVNRTVRAQYPTGVDVYRQVLAAAPNSSVYIAAIGFFSNLSALLQSGADQYSSLTGSQLVSAKVIALVAAAGTFPSSSTPEWNIVHDIASAQYVALHWPTQIWWSGSEVGGSIVVGSGINSLSATNILKYAHAQAPFGETRPAWDDIGAIYAAQVLTQNGYLSRSVNGTVTIDGAGNDSWSSGVQSGHYYLIKQRPDADFVTLINSILVNETAGTIPMLPKTSGYSLFTGTGTIQ